MLIVNDGPSVWLVSCGPFLLDHHLVKTGSQVVFLMVHDGPKVGRRSWSNFVRLVVVDQLSDHRGPLLLRKPDKLPPLLKTQTQQTQQQQNDHSPVTNQPPR